MIYVPIGYLLLLLAPAASYSQQTITLREICLLPEQVQESSGLYIQHADSIWSHNDSGNNRKLYLVDTFGVKIRTIEMVGGNNIDWEDLATDDDGNLYVGDFGNNFQSREDLVIYKTINPALISTENFFAETIYFHYEDQVSYPPPIQQWYFDCEAMLVWGDTIFIFTKDYSLPYNGFTRVYRLPNTPGDHTAIFAGVFYTDNDSFFEGSVTGAAISPDRTKIALISNHKLWVFYNFTGQDFLNGSVKEFKFSEDTQKEAIAFLDDCELYITDELSNDGGGKLYAFNACDYISGTSDVAGGVVSPALRLVQETDVVRFDASAIPQAMHATARISVWNAQGGLIGSFPLNQGEVIISKSDLPTHQVLFYALIAPSLPAPVGGNFISL